MIIKTNSKPFLATLPLLLPLSLLIPYALLASDLLAFKWVWAVGYRPFWLVLGVVLFLALASSVLMVRLAPVGLTLFRVALFISVAHTTFLAMLERRHFLLVVIFGVLVVFVLLSMRAAEVLSLPYFDSKRHWWESMPKAFPHLGVEVFTKSGDTLRGRLANLGAGGCFVFFESPLSQKKFREARVRISGANSFYFEVAFEVAHYTSDRMGWGLAFTPEDEVGLDWQKDLEDKLVEMRRTGYEIA